MRDSVEGAERMVEHAIRVLREEQARLQERLALIARKIDAYETALADTLTPMQEHKTRRYGQTRKREPVMGPEGTEYAGMNVRQAVERLLSEQPGLRPAEIRDILASAGFPFRAKMPLNMVWKAVKTVRETEKNGTGSPV